MWNCSNSKLAPVFDFLLTVSQHCTDDPNDLIIGTRHAEKTIYCAAALLPTQSTHALDKVLSHSRVLPVKVAFVLQLMGVRFVNPTVPAKPIWIQ